jgi:hypothetical protein
LLRLGGVRDLLCCTWQAIGSQLLEKKAGESLP